jgi:sugar fermentation stimulation protein A
MEFHPPLVHGILLKRYKRFLADIRLDNGQIVTAHCTNSGSMKSCLVEGAEVYLSRASDPKRKTQYTWEMIRINKNWVGIHTGHPNRLAFEALLNREIPGLNHYSEICREVKIKDSRLDMVASNDEETCYIEVKNVTMKVGDFARFPDAVTTRGQKHLKTLMELKNEGYRAVMIYIIQRMDVSHFGIASNIDPHYAKILNKAIKTGVELFPLQAKVEPESIQIIRQLPHDVGV